MYWPTPRRNETEIMGYTIRTDKWRYGAWFGFDGKRVTPKTSDIIGRELYSHAGNDGDADFDGETNNVVKDPANEKIVEELHRRILDYIRLYPQGDDVHPRPMSNKEDSFCPLPLGVAKNCSACTVRCLYSASR